MKKWIHALFLRIFDSKGWELEKSWDTGRRTSLSPDVPADPPFKVIRKRWRHARTGLVWENEWLG